MAVSASHKSVWHPAMLSVVLTLVGHICPKVGLTDITYIRTLEGFAYLAVVIDLYSRRVVGWSMQSRQTTDAVLQALHMAVWRRKPKNRVLIHSDQGSQFTHERLARNQFPTAGDEVTRYANLKPGTNAIHLHYRGPMIPDDGQIPIGGMVSAYLIEVEDYVAPE